MKNEIVLRPAYWASVSGGKDSLFMLGVILSNLSKYPLDGVVHFELETDYPFIRDVTNHMENVCKSYGIPFRRYKPRKSFFDLYEKRGYPTRIVRWCNSDYKLDCARQLENDEKISGRKVIYYIGICADEIKRQKKSEKYIYPLAIEGVDEDYILEWARCEKIFNNYYVYCDRCGCAMCPVASMRGLAYTKMMYPELYEKYMNLIIETEETRGFNVFSGKKEYNAFYYDSIIDKKYIPQLKRRYTKFLQGVL